MPYYKNNLNQKIAYKYFKRKNPGIIYVHGLNSDMEGTKAIEIEKYAKKNNHSFLKFDCRGHGKSFGKFEDFTITDWKNDLVHLLDNITKGPQIIIGSSMGGWLMLLAAKVRSERICGLIGIAAAPDFGKELYSSLSIKNKKNLKNKGFTKITTKYGSYILSKKFFKDANKNTVLNKSFKFNKPILLIHGLKDNIVNSKIPIKIMKKSTCKNIQIVYIKSGDHQLSTTNDIITITNAIDNLKEQI